VQLLWLKEILMLLFGGILEGDFKVNKCRIWFIVHWYLTIVWNSNND